MGVIEFDAQPILLNAVVGEAKTSVVHQNAAEVLEVDASVLHADPARLTTCEVEHPDLPLRSGNDGFNLELFRVALTGTERDGHMRVRLPALLHQLASHGRHVVVQCLAHLRLESVLYPNQRRSQFDAEIVGGVVLSGKPSIPRHWRLEHPELPAQVADVFIRPRLLEVSQDNSGAVPRLSGELR